MDEQTALILALQLVALFSIAGALLMYLLCKIRNGSETVNSTITLGTGKPVLVTSADSAIGLQISIYLADRGFRVFSGLKNGAASSSPEDSVPARVIRAWQKHRESQMNANQGSIIALPFDVTREDLLHEAVDIVRAHLPAGEDGIWAVINTSGLSYRGRLDQQDISHWDAMLKTNLVGLLRTTRAFQGLLRNTGGRIITLGCGESYEAGLVAYTATRYAVQGASNGLRQELAPLGIKVVTLNPTGLSPDLLFISPKLKKNDDMEEVSVDISGYLEFHPTVLTSNALQILYISLTTQRPKNNYSLRYKYPWSKPLHLLKLV